MPAAMPFSYKAHNANNAQAQVLVGGAGQTPVVHKIICGYDRTPAAPHPHQLWINVVSDGQAIPLVIALPDAGPLDLSFPNGMLSGKRGTTIGVTLTASGEPDNWSRLNVICS